MKRAQPDWMATLQVGDVLTNGRSYRVVREVSRWQRGRVAGKRRLQTIPGEGPLRGVVFTIRHCSWTKRCYTVLTASDLLTLRFRPAGVRVKLNKPVDAKIAASLHERGTRRTLRCCDVRGIA